MIQPVNPSAIRRSSRLISEPDDFRDAVTGMELSVYFRGKQTMASRVEQYQSANWALDFGIANAPTRTRGMVLGGWASFCLAIGPGDAIWNGQQASPGTLCLLPPGQEVHGSTVARFNWLTAAVSPELWQSCVMLAGVQDTPPRQLTVCGLPDNVFASIKRRFSETRRLLANHPPAGAARCRAMECAAESIAATFTIACGLAARGHHGPCTLRNRARLARAAEEHMISSIDEPMRVPDLCAALRVSRRELEYAFRSIFDQSPRQYLETLRLHAIRRQLKLTDADDGRIIDIAYANGISHLGRFAARYRSLFGENPAQTLRRG